MGGIGAGIGAVAGGLGGYAQAKAANQPTEQWSQRDPWRGGDANWFMDQMRGATEGAAGNVNWGPFKDQRRMYRSMMGDAFGGRGGGGGGGGMAQAMGGGRGRGGGGGGRGGFGKYAKQNVEWDPFAQQVLDPAFFNVADDPLFQNEMQYMQDEYQQNLAGGMNQASMPFINAGGTMGMSGVNAAARQNAGLEGARDMGRAGNQLMLGERGQRMGLAGSVYGDWSGREAAYDQAAIGGEAQLGAAAKAAAAQRYSADQSLRGVMAGVGAQNAAQSWGKQMDMWNMGNQMAGMRRNAQGLGNLGLYGQYGGATLPWQQGFGQQHTKTQGPKQNPWLGALGGAMGGAAGGFGFGSNPGVQQKFGDMFLGSLA